MRIIAQNTLARFIERNPTTEASLSHWYSVAKHANWANTHDVQAAFSKAKVINSERVRFEISGGNYRLIVAFQFKFQIAFIKFIGSHAEYDKVDAEEVSLY